MDSEHELKCLAAVWALRGILTPEGFKDFKLKDGLVWLGQGRVGGTARLPQSQGDAGNGPAPVGQFPDHHRKRGGRGQLDPEWGLFSELGAAGRCC